MFITYNYIWNISLQESASSLWKGCKILSDIKTSFQISRWSSRAWSFYQTSVVFLEKCVERFVFFHQLWFHDLNLFPVRRCISGRNPFQLFWGQGEDNFPEMTPRISSHLFHFFSPFDVFATQVQRSIIIFSPVIWQFLIVVVSMIFRHIFLGFQIIKAHSNSRIACGRSSEVSMFGIVWPVYRDVGY